MKKTSVKVKVLSWIMVCLKSRSNGLALSVANGKAENGTDVRVETYKGINSQHWYIKRVIKDNMVTVNDICYVRGNETPEADVTVTVDGKRLTEEVDYTAETKINGSKGTVTVTGIGDFYCDSVTKEFTVTEIEPATQPPTQTPTQAPTQVSTENPVSDLDNPQIIVSNVTATAGSTISVPITIKNNAGIAGVTLDVTYDKNVLTLSDVKDGEILGTQTHKPEYTSPYTLSWSNDSSNEDITANGVIATLTFTVNNRAAVGEYPIKLSYDYENYDIYDSKIRPVKFNTVDGIISVREVLYGDVNGDGHVNNVDRVVLTRYLAKWNDYQTINLLNADINNDGKVNNLDKVILTRHLAKWSDYSALPHIM